LARRSCSWPVRYLIDLRSCLTVRVRKSEVQKKLYMYRKKKNCTCTEKKKTVHVQKKKSLTPQNSSLFILFIAGCSLFFDEFLGSMKVLHLLSVSPALRELQVRRHLRQFYLSLLVALRVRSQKQNTQLFYLSLLSKWFGLSYRGLSMQQTLGGQCLNPPLVSSWSISKCQFLEH
jgi:hypothetical protein